MFQRFNLCLLGIITLAAADATDMMADDSPSRYLNDSLPQRWSYIPENQMEIPQGIDHWWQQFNDPVLDSLITLGVERNYNLSIAMRRSQMARATMMQAKSGWYPSVSMSAGWTKAQSSGALTDDKFRPTPNSYFDAGLSASWEIDIFGKIASGVKAKKAAYQASRAEYAGAMVSLSAQIASTYLNLRVLQKEYEVAERHAESQRKIVKIAEARYETTLASKLDVAQAWQTYYSTRAAIPMLENSIHTTINALAILIGEYPDRVYGWLGTAAPIPDCNRIVSAGVPMDLLRRRPDIVEAEQELAQYAAELGIAKKDFLPTLTLNGSIGTSAHSIGDMFSKDSFTYSIAPTLSWTIFDGFSRKYAANAAKEAFMAGIDNYNLVVMTAVEETDNAISTYVNSLKHIDAINKVIEQNEEALRLAVDRYKSSLSPMSDVVTAQLTALSAENDLVIAQGDALSALINLYEALGGGYVAE